jgi:hypothetical protein
MWPWGRFGALAVLCSALAGIMGCCCLPAAPLKPSDMVGTYEGDYGNGCREVTELKADGTLEQVFTRDGQEFLRNQGSWRLDPKEGLILYSIGVDLTPWRHTTYTVKVYSEYTPIETAHTRIVYTEWAGHRLKRVSDAAKPRPPADMVGTYKGDYGNGYGEMLELKADGTFEQVFTKDGQEFLRAQGAWNFDAQGQMRLEQGYTDMSPWEHAAYTPEPYRWVQPLEATPRAIIYSEWPSHRLKRVPDAAKPEPAAERATSPAEPAK